MQISRKYRAAVSGYKEAFSDLNAICAVTSTEDQKEWGEAEKHAQANRRNDVKVMDIYDSAMELRKSCPFRNVYELIDIYR